MWMLILNVVYVLVAIAIIALVLMQRGSGAQAGSGFGAGASGTVFGARGASNFLTKTTKWLAVVFFTVSMGMAMYASKQANRQGPAKADLGVARRYAELVPDKALSKAIFGQITQEWQLAVEALEMITGEAERLADNRTLARSIAHRFAYIAPLNHLQVELLRRWRAGETDDKAQRGILISINGIAAGLRNTG